MTTTYQIPASSTDVLDLDVGVESPSEAIVLPKVTISPVVTLPADRTATGQVPTIARSATRTVVGLVTAVYLGVRPVILDERTDVDPRIWGWVATSNGTSLKRSTGEVIEHSLSRALSSMSTYEIQDGMTLPMGLALASWLHDFGERGLGRLASIAITAEGNSEALSHALRWIGRMGDPSSIYGRLRLLIGVLKASSATVRDGAALGLVELGSPLAIGPIEEAALRETNQSLRRDLEQAAEYLKHSS